MGKKKNEARTMTQVVTQVLTDSGTYGQKCVFILWLVESGSSIYLGNECGKRTGRNVCWCLAVTPKKSNLMKKPLWHWNTLNVHILNSLCANFEESKFLELSCKHSFYLPKLIVIVRFFCLLSGQSSWDNLWDSIGWQHHVTPLTTGSSWS